MSAMMIGLMATLACAENIDPDNDDSQYAYGENVGWLNFEPSSGPGVQVGETQLSGYLWAENIGWINLSPASHGGVSNNGVGQLSGYAWSENVGWINFHPSYGGVSIDSEGNFDGWAWGENIGWIRFDSTEAYNVKVCIVGLDDLAQLVDEWLSSGSPASDWNGDGDVDLEDYALLVSTWLGYCPY